MKTAPLYYPIADPESANVEVTKHVDKWRDQEGNLIMILHSIQNEYGYVPREISMELAKELEVSLARIYEVITFYHYFKLVPPGKHTIAVCTGTACYLKGSANVLKEMESQLAIQEGQTTDDREFHLETVRCIGCCGMSPAITTDGKVHGRVRSADVAEILAKMKKQEAAS